MPALLLTYAHIHADTDVHKQQIPMTIHLMYAYLHTNKELILTYIHACTQYLEYTHQ